MADPSSTYAGILGVKYATVVAGFAGGVASLIWLKELTKAQMLLAVFTGAASAGYMTPVAIPLLARAIGAEATPALENSAAFLVGLCSMNIIPGVMRLSEIFRRDPAGAIRGRDEQP